MSENLSEVYLSGVNFTKRPNLWFIPVVLVLVLVPFHFHFCYVVDAALLLKAAFKWGPEYVQ